MNDVDRKNLNTLLLKIERGEKLNEIQLILYDYLMVVDRCTRKHTHHEVDYT